MLTLLFSDLQPIGRAYALVQPTADRSALNTEPVKSTEEQVEIIKVSAADLPVGCCLLAKWVSDAVVPALFQVYLEARRQEQQNHQQNLKMLSDEVSQIQEVSMRTTSDSVYSDNQTHTVSTVKHHVSWIKKHLLHVYILICCTFLSWVALSSCKCPTLFIQD